VAAQEAGHDLVDAPRRRTAEDAEGDGSGPERRELTDAACGVFDGAQAAGGVLGERATGFRRPDAAMAGLDYVSCSPYRVPIARAAAAQAALRATCSP
jgi:hypothetical protein